MAYRNPKPTVDVVIRTETDGDPGVVLIRRKNPPAGWALPGGFVDEGETVEAAAVREVMEETGLAVELEELLYVYSDPARDLRMHTLSVVFTGRAEGLPTGGDDAADARVFPLATIRAVVSGASGPGLPSPLAFDHARILDDFLHFLDTGRRPHP